MRNQVHSLHGIARDALPSVWRHGLTAIVALVACLIPLSFATAGFVSGSYRVDIAESERLLDAMLKNQRGQITYEQMKEIEMQEMCRNPSIRMIDRNRPAILLQNTSGETSENELSQFTIDMQEFGYEFGTGDFDPDIFNNGLTFLSSMSDSGISISSSYGSVSDNDPTPDPTKLVIDIEGLTAGKALMLRFDIDPLPVIDSVFPDFRTALLGADSGNGPTSPALIAATFAEGEGSERMTSSTNYSEFTREFESEISSGIVEGYNTQSHPEMNTQTDSTVPEPSAGVLLLVGLGFIARQRRLR